LDASEDKQFSLLYTAEKVGLTAAFGQESAISQEVTHNMDNSTDQEEIIFSNEEVTIQDAGLYRRDTFFPKTRGYQIWGDMNEDLSGFENGMSANTASHFNVQTLLHPPRQQYGTSVFGQQINGFGDTSNDTNLQQFPTVSTTNCYQNAVNSSWRMDDAYRAVTADGIQQSHFHPSQPSPHSASPTSTTGKSNNLQIFHFLNDFQLTIADILSSLCTVALYHQIHFINLTVLHLLLWKEVSSPTFHVNGTSDVSTEKYGCIN
jgi:hypothetical protein